MPASKLTFPETAVPVDVTFTRPPARDVLPVVVKMPPTDPFPVTERIPDKPRLVALTIFEVPFIMRVPASKFTLPAIVWFVPVMDTFDPTLKLLPARVTAVVVPSLVIATADRKSVV